MFLDPFFEFFAGLAIQLFGIIDSGEVEPFWQNHCRRCHRTR
jgi:hypothetical protein